MLTYQKQKAETSAICIVDCDPNLSPSDLKLIFNEMGEEAFSQDVLKDWIGFKSPSDQVLVTRVLKEACSNPEEQIDYLLGYFCNDGNLRCVEKEKNIIRQMLAPANLKVKAARHATQIIKHTADDNSRVLHFAMHGNVQTGSDSLPTLKVMNSIGSIVPRNILIKVLSLCSKNGSGSSMECIFFNACTTHELASSSLHRERRVKWMVSWKKEVDDDAAMCFAEPFYHFLGSNPENTSNFKE